jgi:hypothetical protein
MARVLAFCSVANLVPWDTNGLTDVFVRDLTTGTTSLVSLGFTGAQADGSSRFPALSADGGAVAFESGASNLVAGDTNGADDVFERDLSAGVTMRMSVDSVGAQAASVSSSASISGNGSLVAFESLANNLVSNDTNATWDVFVHDRGALHPTAYCTAGTTTHGCIPAISSMGTPSASSSSSFVIWVNALEGQALGVLFYGVDNTGFLPLPWGVSTSYLCVKAPTQRTAVQSSGGAAGMCDGSMALDWNVFVASHPTALGQPFVAGERAFAQAWFRDPPSPKSTMLSDALEFTLVP